MFSHYKKLGLLICIFALPACGLFSDEKNLPQGTRISILADKEISHTAPTAHLPRINVPQKETNYSWQQTGGNANHLMQNISVGSDMQKVWSAKFGKGSSKRNLIISQPVVANNIIAVQDVNGDVSAFRLDNGQKLWKQKLKPILKHETGNGLNGSGLAADYNAVYAATGFGSVFALNLKNGNILWRHNIDTPIRTAPTLCNNKIYIKTLDNRLIALNANNGSEIWKYNISSEDTVLAGGAASACSIEKNLLVSGFSNGEIQAFNANVGYPLWSALMISSQQVRNTTEINAIKAAPVIEDSTIYAVGHSNSTAAIDYRSGEKKWEQKIGGTNMPWVAGNALFIIDNEHNMAALDKESGKLIWSTPLLQELDINERNGIYLSGPIMFNSRLLATSSNGIVYILSPENGKILDRYELGKNLPVAPVAALNKIIFVTDSAELAIYK